MSTAEFYIYCGFLFPISTCIFTYTQQVVESIHATVSLAYSYSPFDTCIPVADHVDIWQNQYNIVKLKNK